MEQNQWKRKRGRKYGEIIPKEGNVLGKYKAFICHSMKLFEQLQFLTLFNHITLLVMSLKYTKCTIHHFESCYTGYTVYHIHKYIWTHKVNQNCKFSIFRNRRKKVDTSRQRTWGTARQNEGDLLQKNARDTKALTKHSMRRRFMRFLTGNE